MAKIVRFEKYGNVVEIVSETWKTRNAWGHKSTLFINGYEESVAKIRYYNRTWESYTYQKSMEKVIRDFMKSKLESECEYTFKRLECYKRITQKMRERMEKSLLAFDDTYKALYEIYVEL